MHFPDTFFPDVVELAKPDGTCLSLRVQLTRKGEALTQDVATAIEEGDELRRTLPNGMKERYRITGVHFQSAAGGLPALYTCRVQKATPETVRGTDLAKKADPSAPRAGENKMSNTEQNAVFVVHGRDGQTRDALYSWLRTLGAKVLTWEDAEALKPGVQSNFEIVEQAISVATAVIVLFTPDETVRLRPELDGDDAERYQPRANVLFEAGWAFGAHRSKTIVVEVGMTHHVSDIDGFNNVRMFDAASLNKLATRLETIGCKLNRNDASWMDPSRYPQLFPAKGAARTP